MTKITRINPPILPSRKKRRVAAYARVSVDYEKNIESLNTQISYYTSLIQNNLSWQYAGVYYDKGVTGTKINRPGFKELMYQCAIGNVDMIITKSISRLNRNTVDLLATVRSLKKKELIFISREKI